MLVARVSEQQPNVECTQTVEPSCTWGAIVAFSSYKGLDEVVGRASIVAIQPNLIRALAPRPEWAGNALETIGPGFTNQCSQEILFGALIALIQPDLVGALAFD